MPYPVPIPPFLLQVFPQEINAVEPLCQDLLQGNHSKTGTKHIRYLILLTAKLGPESLIIRISIGKSKTIHQNKIVSTTLLAVNCIVPLCPSEQMNYEPPFRT